MPWTNTATLSAEDRVKLIVGGNFTIDALGPVYTDTLAAIDADPMAHFRAFERLYLSRKTSRSTLTELFLPAFLALIKPHIPNEARRAARALLTRSDALAQTQEAELAEADDEASAGEIGRQRRQLEARRSALNAIIGD